MGKIKYRISKVLSLLTVISFVWLIVENIIIEILNFSLIDNFKNYFDSLIFPFILIPTVLFYNWFVFGIITVWMEVPKSEDVKDD